MPNFIDRTGEVGYNNQGKKMTIISCKNSHKIDIQFDDGSIIYDKSYDSFKKGKIFHVAYEESILYHIEVELGLDINNVWNWDKNNELEIYPNSTSKHSHKKVWLYCQEKDYHNYDKEGNRVGYETSCNSFSKGCKCGYCGKNKTHWKDSLAYNYPKVAKMIAIKENNLTFEDCYNIAPFSSKKFYFKCNECENISSKLLKLNNITRRGYSCEFCSDGVSIPNKFMNNLLTQLNVDFKHEYSPCYFKNSKRIDFLLIDYNIIIEMDGGYGNHTREYDYWRDFLNMKYGGYKTIRIDLKDDNRYKKDTFNYIKEQIVDSELSNIFNLDNINWELAWEESQNSLCVKTWKLWNSGIHDVSKLSLIIGVNRGTIRIYLKRGSECKKCNYTKEESIKDRNLRLKK